MRFLTFVQSILGRALWVLTGAVLIWSGFQERSMAGLLLVMIGFVPVVTGIANMRVIDEIAHALGFDSKLRRP